MNIVKKYEKKIKIEKIKKEKGKEMTINEIKNYRNNKN